MTDSAVNLVREYGSPLYVLDEEVLRENCRKYVSTIKENYPDFLVAYASKALSAIGILDVLAEEGLGADVVSGGELYTALKSKVKPENILFHGNNKSGQELEYAIQEKIKIVIDNGDELEKIIQIAEKLNKKVEVLIRLKPEIEAHTHDFIKTGQIDSKFGVEIRNLLKVVERINNAKNVDYLGLHAHIGSQIFDVEPFEELVRLLVQHSVEIRDALGIETKIINIGGGIGITYTASDDPPTIEDFILRITNKLKQECQKRGLDLPKLIIEPGRSIIGSAGVTLYTIGTIKEIKGIKTYLFVDGGMADNIRPMLYQAKYDFEIANKKDQEKLEKYTIAGKFCESSDILAENVMLPKAEVGDILLVKATGAYNYSMASNYNRFCKPAMVMVNNGKARLIIRREDFKDLIRNDL
ncbi:diaminopimelate decarboxylase [Candidatus Margulisiibacteriota bacterium]